MRPSTQSTQTRAVRVPGGRGTDYKVPTNAVARPEKTAKSQKYHVHFIYEIQFVNSGYWRTWKYGFPALAGSAHRTKSIHAKPREKPSVDGKTWNSVLLLCCKKGRNVSNSPILPNVRQMPSGS